MELVDENDPILKTRTEKIPEINLEFRNLVEEMFLFMEASRGIGLAAPQIGIPERFFIMKQGGRKFVCVDPQILKYSEEMSTYKEGCLSFPGTHFLIERPESIKVSFYDSYGKKFITRMRNLRSHIFQHETDHIEGITFHDRR